MITHIAFATLYVADQEVMRRYFADALGFTTETDAEMGPGKRWLEMGVPGAKTRLVVAKAEDFDRAPDTAYPLNFAAADLVSTAKAIEAAGFAASEVVDEPWGSYFTATDPEGRELMIGKAG